MEKETKKAINLAYNEIEEVYGYLLAVRNNEINTEDLLESLEKLQDRLGTALDSLEKYTSDDLSNLKT